MNVRSASAPIILYAAHWAGLPVWKRDGAKYDAVVNELAASEDWFRSIAANARATAEEAFGYRRFAAQHRAPYVSLACLPVEEGVAEC